MKIKIDKDIPLPLSIGYPTRREAVEMPLNDMVVGDSFFIAHNDIPIQGIHPAVCYARKRLKRGFTAHKCEGVFWSGVSDETAKRMGILEQKKMFFYHRKQLQDQ